MRSGSGRRLRYPNPAPNRLEGACQSKGHSPGWNSKFLNVREFFIIIFHLQVHLMSVSRTNPTKLNGTRIENDVEMELYQNDIFTIGDR